MADNPTTSLFDYISAAVVDGQLPEDFSLPKLVDGDDEIVFADGAMDGIGIYHMYPQEMEVKDYALMTKAIQAANKHNFDKADKLFTKLAETSRAISVIDELQFHVHENKKYFKAGNLYEYALWLMLCSSNRECVKYGLSLLELFKTDNNESVKNDIRTIGLSDEFTLFAVLNMRRWKDGNNEIFELAKKVHGWGRIHAIEKLEATTDAIKKWLLTEAVNNDVMPSYSALSCWEKSGAEQILMNHPSYEEFAGIRDIMEGLLDEGPVSGLSALDNTDALLDAFLSEATRLSESLTLEDYEIVRKIYEYYSERGLSKSPTALACRKVLTTYKCWHTLIDAAKTGRGIDTAIAAGIDCKPYIRDLIKTDFKKSYALCRYLADDDEYRKELLEIYRDNLPLDEMKTKPGTTLGLGEEYWQQSALEFLMQELRYYPYEGLEFVVTGLQSEPVRTRNGALTVLALWVQKEGKPLVDILPDIHSLVQELQKIEPEDGPGKLMDKLLCGETVFEEKPLVLDESTTFSENTLAILSDAISDIGSWQWWVVDGDMVQLEFCNVQLYDDTKPPKAPHSSTIALRFYGNSFAAFLDNLDGEEEKKWYDKLHDDEIEPFSLEGFAFEFNNAQYVNEVFESYANKTEIKALPDSDIVTPQYILAAQCHEVAFVVGGDELEIVSHAGVFAEEDIEKAHKRWWEYWEDYWRKGKTKDAYEKDWACEMTIPADIKSLKKEK